MKVIPRHWQSGFTLIEMLVVVTLVGVLALLLIPALNQAQEAARRTRCMRNLYQIGLGVQNYHDTFRLFPLAEAIDLGNDRLSSAAPWSIHARILPFIDQSEIYDRINFSLPWDSQTIVSGVRINTYYCPSDPASGETSATEDGNLHVYPTNYGFNHGNWFVYDPATNRGGNGVFAPNGSIGMKDMRDGTTRTVLAVDVLSWQSYSFQGELPDLEIPDDEIQALAVINSGLIFQNDGHSCWADGRVHQTGFTTCLTPNSHVVSASRSGPSVDNDYVSWKEGMDGRKGSPTFAIVTARSRHPGGVNTAMVDGSVTFFSDSIDLSVWRALGTRDGKEMTIEY